VEDLVCGSSAGRPVPRRRTVSSGDAVAAPATDGTNSPCRRFPCSVVPRDGHWRGERSCPVTATPPRSIAYDMTSDHVIGRRFRSQAQSADSPEAPPRRRTFAHAQERSRAAHLCERGGRGSEQCENRARTMNAGEGGAGCLEARLQVAWRENRSPSAGTEEADEYPGDRHERASCGPRRRGERSATTSTEHQRLRLGAVKANGAARPAADAEPRANPAKRQRGPGWREHDARARLKSASRREAPVRPAQRIRSPGPTAARASLYRPHARARTTRFLQAVHGSAENCGTVARTLTWLSTTTSSAVHVPLRPAPQRADGGVRRESSQAGRTGDRALQGEASNATAGGRLVTPSANH
jgi:hypothetical protein